MLSASFRKQFSGGPEIVVADLRIGPGITVLFGASGSGKTTILRCLAGLERPDTGEIQFGDEVWFRSAENYFRPPQQRKIGYVPQQYALFPHLTVAENIGYGLNGLATAERQARVAEALEWLGLAEMAVRRPLTLSGGEQQRVALARAVVRQPHLLLLDEPFSVLDTVVRLRLRGELAILLARLKTPVILVTHDRWEAAALGQEMVVLERGKILQRGSVTEVFNLPANPEVARLVGTATVLAGTVTERAEGFATVVVNGIPLTASADKLPVGAVAAHVCIRAEDVLLAPAGDAPSSARNRLTAVVRALTGEGPLVCLELDCGFPLKALLTRQAQAELNLHPGDRVTAMLKASQIHVI